MSELIAIAYPDKATVERARENLRSGVSEGLVEVEDAVVMFRGEDGTLEVRQGGTGVGGAAEDVGRPGRRHEKAPFPGLFRNAGRIAPATSGYRCDCRTSGGADRGRRDQRRRAHASRTSPGRG